MVGYTLIVQVSPDTVRAVRIGVRPRVHLRTRPPHVHHGLMAVTYAVIAGSEDEVRTALQQLADLLGLEKATLPTQLPGQERWLGRLTTPTPAAVVREAS